MIKISTDNEVLFFKAYQIICFEAKTKTTIIHFLNGKTSEINESIESIEKQIKSNDFIQINQSHLINVNHITGIPSHNPDFIELNKTLLLPISNEQRKIIIQLISAHLKT